MYLYTEYICAITTITTLSMESYFPMVLHTYRLFCLEVCTIPNSNVELQWTSAANLSI